MQEKDFMKKVKMLSFNSTENPDIETPSNENYWKLIGKTGVVSGYPEEYNFHDKSRLLIVFDVNLDNIGLENHNEIPNSLWILKSDLEFI